MHAPLPAAVKGLVFVGVTFGLFVACTSPNRSQYSDVLSTAQRAIESADAFIEARQDHGLLGDLDGVNDKRTHTSLDGVILVAYEHQVTAYNGPVVEVLTYDVATDAVTPLAVRDARGNTTPVLLGRPFAATTFNDFPTFHSSWKNNGLADCVQILEYEFDFSRRAAVETANRLQRGLVDGSGC